MTKEPSQREPIEEIAEEFLARLRRGEHPSLTEYASQHPELAARIRDLFPTLVMMERFGDPEDSSLGAPNEVTEDGAPERRLGEYRILREVGRGGMGVVYEAEQESLGRHVALKVLASHWRLDAKQLKRFQREARAVARLQHPNIVPVHGIGEHRGIPYYVMQFIRGQGLDGVLEELRAITVAKQGLPSDADNPPTLASQVARRLVQVGHAGLALGADSIGMPSTDSHVEGSGSKDRLLEPPLTGPSGLSTATGSAVAALAGQTESVGRSSTSIYFQSVARIGVQVAEALAYAHDQGILHRDIKPSNLLVDESGTVWITDFGLAKASTEDNLTDSGDMVGTLRYMAPEQLRGWADPRSDVYGLGVTLYELLALRPAFDEKDRALLMRQVLDDNPPRLKKLCRNVPLDLETIVHKAIAKEPEQRYATASELGADLRRFMEGKPIQARRTPVHKRAWLWSRRNPLVAGLLAILLVFLPAALLLVTSLWRDAERERQAVTAKNQENRRLLGEAYLAEAKALRSSRRPERGREALEVLARAAAIQPTVETRNEAIAALAQPGLELICRWRPPSEAYYAPCFDAKLERYALVQGNTLTVRSTAGDEVLLRQELKDDLIPAPGPAQASQFLPEGDILLLCRPAAGWQAIIWDLHAARARWVSPRLSAPVVTVDRGSRHAAVVTRPGFIEIHDLASKEVVQTIDLSTTTDRLHFHPHGTLLATETKEGEVRIYDWCTANLVARTKPTPFVIDFNWSPDGQYLVVGSGDYRTYVWSYEGEDALNLRAVLTTHQAEVVRTRFSPDGRYLATSSWDGSTIFWETRGFREVFRTPGVVLGFGAYGRRVATATSLDLSYCLWSLRQPVGVTQLEGHLPGGKGPKQVDVSPNGRLIASASFDGVRVWDLARKQHLLHLPGDMVSAWFHPNGNELLACGVDGVRAWPLTLGPPDESGDLTLTAGPMQALTEPRFFSRLAMDATGSTLAAVDWNRRQVAVWTQGRRTEPRIDKAFQPVREVSLSPDGRWLVSATWHGLGVRLADAQTGAFVRDVYPESGAAILAFSPDGRWFAAGSGAEYRLWEVEGWKLHRTFPRQQGGNLPGPIAFSRDGRIMAIAPTVQTVRLVQTETGAEIATFEGPNLLTWLCLSPNGGHLICGTENQIVQIWDLRELNDALAPLGLNWL